MDDLQQNFPARGYQTKGTFILEIRFAAIETIFIDISA